MSVLLILVSVMNRAGARTAEEEAARAALKRQKLITRAEAAERAERYKTAAKRYARAAAETEDKRERARLELRQAECLLRAGKLRSAFEAYQKLLDTYPFFVPYSKVVAQLHEIAARFAQGEGAVFAGTSRELAVEVYQFILMKAPAEAAAAADALRLARLQTDMEDYEDAVFSYRDVIKRYPRAPEAADARVERARVLLTLSERADADGRLVGEARNELTAFIRLYPEHQRRAEADELYARTQERQATALVQLGEFYLRPAHERVPAARRYLHDTVRRYPDTEAAALAKTILARVGEGDETEVAAAPETKPAVRRKFPAGPALPARPEDMTPEKARVQRAIVPLKTADRLQKWLLPLEDLEADLGETN
jgi:tetratricopeptide (TPR) repeat protein